MAEYWKTHGQALWRILGQDPQAGKQSLASTEGHVVREAREMPVWSPDKLQPLSVMEGCRTPERGGGVTWFQRTACFFWLVQWYSHGDTQWLASHLWVFGVPSVKASFIMFQKSGQDLCLVTLVNGRWLPSWNMHSCQHLGVTYGRRQKMASKAAALSEQVQMTYRASNTDSGDEKGGWDDQASL